eukprot:TRINITY_DN5029_c0_g1_i1.p1 TRINITY_DN5029_c0_g1~~TRINITY_DN5029_c0_g1_i1.p1  ORF type:complete len:295 (+),score=61.29 TRINITY_DN5029_c0_g1_i1:52-936(+)
MSEPSSATTENVLVEFRAGRMTTDASIVKPDNRKGLVQLFADEDGIIHFSWKDRTTGKVEEDRVVVPPDQFKLVSQAKGRVFLLDCMENIGDRLFFWMQEPNSEKDTEFCESVNKYINNPDLAQPAAGIAAAPAPVTPAAVPSFGSSQPSAATSASPAPVAATPAIDTAQLAQQLLRGLMAMQGQQPPQRGPDLARVLNPDDVVPLLADAEARDRLVQFLPEGSRNDLSTLSEHLRSPQMIQVLDSLTMAISGPHAAEVFSSFELPPGYGVEAFLNALQAAVQSRTREGSANSQ